jgi:hypothetical protein
MRFLVGVAFVVVVASTACGGDDGLTPPPPTLTAGPVTIDTQTLTLTIAGTQQLQRDHFLSIGTASPIVENHYYDPRGDDLDTATKRLQARVFASTAETRSIVVR